MIVKIKVDQTNPAQVEALGIFLRSFSDKGAKTEPAAKPKQAKPATAQPAAALVALGESAIVAGRAQVPQPEPAAAPEPEPAKAEPLRIEDVRAAVAVKAPKHLAALRAELARLGAASVTNLDAAHYAEFLDFVNALPA